MNHWKRLAVPAALGVIAAIVNWMTVTAKIRPETFVAVKHDVAYGETLGAADLVKIELSGNLGSLRQAAVGWEHRACMYGRRAPRELVAGDVVLWRDLNDTDTPGVGEDMVSIPLSHVAVVPRLILVGQKVGFWVAVPAEEDPVRSSGKTGSGHPADDAVDGKGEYLGPFRVLAVGERASRGTEAASSGKCSEDRVLTIAVRLDPKTRQLDHRTARLVAAVNAQGKGRIMAILLHNSEHESAPEDGNPGQATASRQTAALTSQAIQGDEP
jgi:hypothetical protein